MLNLKYKKIFTQKSLNKRKQKQTQEQMVIQNKQQIIVKDKKNIIDKKFILIKLVLLYYSTNIQT